VRPAARARPPRSRARRPVDRRPPHVAHLQSDPGFELREHDIAHALPHDAYPAMRIFNLACPASPAHYQRAPGADDR
jgi:hypothetical protein